MIGVKIVKPDGSIAPEMRDRLVVEGFKAGIVLLPCRDSVMQFCPPLVIARRRRIRVCTGLKRLLKRLLPEFLRVRMRPTDLVWALSRFTDSIENFSYQAVDLGFLS
jgi:hypothetical protein